MRRLLRRARLSNLPLCEQVRAYDHAAVAVCMYVFFCVTTSFSVFETIGAPFTHDNLGWGVSENSLFFTLAALASVLFFVVVKPLAARIGDRWTLLLGLVVRALKGARAYKVGV
jgi:Na+/melibiose symporter-like transporter